MQNDLKNDLDTKDSINNTFISNQLSKTNNIELFKALENGFKLIDLSDDEINIIINSIQNNEIKKSYIKKVENQLNLFPKNVGLTIIEADKRFQRGFYLKNNTA